MAGGLMQLVAYGAQDVYLTGNPKVTFFQAVYKRHTNFAMEMIEQVVNGSAADSGRLSVTIARNGDLIGNMFLEMPMNGAAAAADVTDANISWMAERAVQDIELTIGGQRIDKHYQRYWRLYAELYLDNAKKAEWGKMTSAATAIDSSAATSMASVRLPLIFFFNRNPGLYLPLIALQYHEVRLDIDLSAEYSAYFGTGIKVWGNYVYLDTEERRRFAQKGHEYLIEQVQHTGADSIADDTTKTVRLSYNHPVKELMWCFNNSVSSGATGQLNELWCFTANPTLSLVTTNVFAVTDGTSNVLIQPHLSGAPFLCVGGTALGGNAGQMLVEKSQGLTAPVAVATGANVAPLQDFKLVLNGQDRFKVQNGSYFNQYQPYQYHSGTPYPGIYSYSFALKPEEHQPTGSCNFSRIDNAQVQISIKGLTATLGASGVMSMFATNYNVLRIQSGMGGLAFSN